MNSLCHAALTMLLIPSGMRRNSVSIDKCDGGLRTILKAQFIVYSIYSRVVLVLFGSTFKFPYYVQMIDGIDVITEVGIVFVIKFMRLIFYC